MTISWPSFSLSYLQQWETCLCPSMTTLWPLKIRLMTRGRGGLVVSSSTCSVRGPRFESHHGQLCVYRDGYCGRQPSARLCLTAVPRSTQPCIPSRSLNRLPASARVRVGMSPLSGGRQHSDPIWYVSLHSGKARLPTKGKPLYHICFCFLL